MTASMVADLVASRDFIEFGHARADHDGVAVIAVDNTRHPVQVWRPSKSPVIGYARTASAHHVVATNGPMVGRAVPLIGKVTKSKLVAGAALPILAAAPAVFGCRRPRRRVGLAAMAVFGSASSMVAMLRRWTACGHVVSGGRRITTTFDGQGPEHAFLALLGDGTISIGDGHPPTHSVEAVGGLVRLVRGGKVPELPLPTRSPAVGWGIARDGDRQVVLVVGGTSLDLRQLAGEMASLGADDAVATDPSGCALLVHRQKFVLGPPMWHRRAIQRVGLACGGRR